MLETKRDLLLTWHMGLRILHRGSFMAAKHYSQLNIALGIPVVIVTSIAGSTIFATSGETSITTTQTYLQYIAGALSLTGTVMASLQTFLNFGDRAAKYKEAAVRYGELRTEIQVLLTEDLEAITDLGERIDSIRERWSATDRESPPLPKRIYDRAETLVKKPAK